MSQGDMTPPAMERYTEFDFSLDADRKIVLASAPGVFMPTGTTKLLIQAVQAAVSEPVTLLDLGCGSGVVGIALHMHGLVKAPLFASDLSEAAVRCSRINTGRYGCPSDVRRGPLFEPWPGQRFDVIVDDISGVAREIAAVSPWFDGVPCESGKDGTQLVADVIRKAPRHLAKHGRFFFPVISLSNVDVLLTAAHENFNSVERVSRQEWPLPDELKQHLPLLVRLKDEGCIKLHERFGMVLWYTEIYCASEARD